MKGVVFVEMLSMAESLIGEDQVDEILDNVSLASDGAYCSVGNYPCSELMILVDAFSQHTGVPAADLQCTFGRWIFGKFSQAYGTFFEGKNDALMMLESIEGEVHLEVRKLYPDVELPTFATRRVDPFTLEMVYTSERPLVDFCRGMIEACMAHFSMPADIQQENFKAGDRFGARFNIRVLAEIAA